MFIFLDLTNQNGEKVEAKTAVYSLCIWKILSFLHVNRLYSYYFLCLKLYII